MDRKTERRVTELKAWRTRRSKELKLDPGVLCPNASLEAIACQNPTQGSDLDDVPELKRWFVRAFGDEVAEALAETATSSKSSGDSTEPESGAESKAAKKGGKKPSSTQ